MNFSVEFFPPSEEMLNKVCNIVQSYITKYKVNNISITHGASGSKKDKSLIFIEEILERNILPAQSITAHLSCAGLERTEVINYVKKFHDIGIKKILVIKGDPTAKTAESGYKTTSEAIVDIKKYFPDITIVAACFPEPRQGLNNEIEILQEKITSGAEHFISQFCFENHFFENFYEEILKHNIRNEITIGLIIPSPQTLNFAKKCYANIPNSLYKIAENEIKAVQFVVDQIKFIKSIGFNSVHLYSLNKLDCTKVLDGYLNSL